MESTLSTSSSGTPFFGYLKSIRPRRFLTLSSALTMAVYCLNSS